MRVCVVLQVLGQVLQVLGRMCVVLQVLGLLQVLGQVLGRGLLRSSLFIHPQNFIFASPGQP